MGYHRAGFDVFGVDIEKQPRYPFEFMQADAFMFLRNMLDDHPEDNGGMSIRDFAAIHASPPCQAYSRARHTPGAIGKTYPDLLAKTFKWLDRAGKPWVIENVPGAPMGFAIELCGTQFGLRVRRHRLFASSTFLFSPPEPCRHEDGDLTVFGNCVQVTGSRGVAYTARSGRTHYRPLRTSSDEGRKAMGCEWMSRKELSQAIPPAYCEFIGRQLLGIING